MTPFTAPHLRDPRPVDYVPTDTLFAEI
jgi:hypothetical protein